MVVCIGLNIVVHDVPWHILGVQAFAPRLERWRPEVHHDGLWFAGEFDRGVILVDPAYLLTVNRPSNEIGCPCNLIDMPVVFGIKAGFIIMRFALRRTITIDGVHREGVL